MELILINVCGIIPGKSGRYLITLHILLLETNYLTQKELICYQIRLLDSKSLNPSTSEAIINRPILLNTQVDWSITTSHWNSSLRLETVLQKLTSVDASYSRSFIIWRLQYVVDN